MGRPPFQSLEKLILWQIFDLGWENLEGAEEHLHYAQTYIDAFILANQPQHICVNNLRGPYSVKALIYDDRLMGWRTDDQTHNPTPRAPGVPIVTHYMYGNTIVMPRVALGAVNRYIAIPGTLLQTLEGEEADAEIGMIIASHFSDRINYWLRTAAPQPGHKDEHWDTSVSNTVIEFYGHSMGNAGNSWLLRQDTTEFNAPSKSSYRPDQIAGAKHFANSAFEERAMLRSKEAQLNAFLAGLLRQTPGFPRDWTRRVNFNRWQDAPTCECCGWTVESLRDDFMANLPLEDVDDFGQMAAMINGD